MSTFIRKINIPIYDAQLWVCVFPDGEFATESAKAHKRLLKGDCEVSEFEGCGAMHAWRGKKHLLLFCKGNLNADHVSHELFHLTHRIMEYRNFNFGPDHHEQGAYLIGWLTGKVTDLLFKVTPKRLR